MLEFRVLGPFSAIRDGTPISSQAWGRRKTETLLKILLTDRGRVFSDDVLVEALYDPGTQTSGLDGLRGNLRGRVGELRRALEPDLRSGRDSRFIVRMGEGYCFSSRAHVWLDVEEFEQRVNAAEQAHEMGDLASAATNFEEAIALFQGDYLETDPYVEWALALRKSWREKRLGALSELADCYAELGSYKKSIACSRRILECQPTRESSTRRLMKLYSLSGQASLALEAHEEAKQALHDYLGVEPSAETEGLFEEIRQGKEIACFGRNDPLRVAVLPFRDLCMDPQNEFLVEGLAEELVHALAKHTELKVISPTSTHRYKSRGGKSIAQIGRELRAGSLIDGSVRREADTLRITTQLVDAASETQVWAGEYDRRIGDILEIHKDIARRVAKQLLTLLPSGTVETLRPRYAGDPRAYELFLEGQYFLRKRHGDSLQKARETFEQALEVDPDFSRARASLATTLWLLTHIEILPFEDGISLTEMEARKALAGDDEAGEAYGALAAIQALAHYNLRRAEELYTQAVEAEPQNTELRHHRAVNLLFLGDFGAAIRVYQEALEIAPISSRYMRSLAYCLDFDRRPEEALVLLRRAERLETNDWALYSTYGNVYLHLRQYEKAADALARTIALDKGTNQQPSIGQTLHSYARECMGEHGALQASVAEMSESPSRDPAAIAVGCFLLGQLDTGFEWLQRARDEHAGWYLYILREPLLDPARDDPRFQAHLVKLDSQLS